MGGEREGVHRHEEAAGEKKIGLWWPGRTVARNRCGEMRVEDLKDDDRTEALMLRMESRDGGHLTWLEPIMRDGGKVVLGEGMVLGREKCLKLEGFFE